MSIAIRIEGQELQIKADDGSLAPALDDFRTSMRR